VKNFHRLRFANIVLLLILVFIIGACGAVETFEQAIQLEAAETGQPIVGAQVRAEIGVRDVVEATTDAQGIARLAIDTEHQAGWAKVIVEADGYEQQSFLVELIEDSPSAIIEMQPPGAETPAATETPAVDAGTATAEPPVGATGDAVGESLSPSNELADLLPAERANYYQSRPAMMIDPNQTYRATIRTNKGDIVVSLDAKASPEHVNNFIFLSNQGFYNGMTFHRVEPGFVIQGGDPLGTGEGGPGYTLPGEFSLTHAEGALAMARLPDQINPNRESSGSQFYITLAATPQLDGQYSVFGEVEEGMEVVQSIQIGDQIEQVIVEPLP
jgi:cyclophilin family peptidyl-prolyl cis-trans isomerase